MPPMRLLSKDFIGSMLSSEKKEKPQSIESCEVVATMEISDDESETSPQYAKLVRRRAIESAEKAMRVSGAKKKEAVTNIEGKIKCLTLDYVKDFDL